MHVLRALRGASRHARRLSTSAAAAPAGGAAAAAGRAFRVQPYDDVPLLERAPRSALPAESLAATFTRTPIGEHSEADTRRYYELTTEQIERCFPEGFGSGVLREFSATNLPALMVRPSALAARRTLDALAADSDALRSASALVLSGARGAGKSATFSYLVHSARSSGWLVLLVPSAHRYINNQQRFTPLSSLRIEIGIVCAAAEGAGQASTADRSASPLAAVGESAASLEQLFDVTAATSALLRGFLRAHEPTLASLPVQCAETRAFAKALSAQVSSLADLVQLGTVTDAAGVPTELASHTLVALVRELRRVTAVPVLIAIDDVNAFDRGTIFRDPHSAFPIDASRFLLPAILGSAQAAGAALRRGTVLCAHSSSLSYHPHEPARRRKRRVQAGRVRAPWAPTAGPSSSAATEEGGTAAMAANASAMAAAVAPPIVLDVPSYDEAELLAALSAYAHTAAWLPSESLRPALGAEKAGKPDGAARQVHMLTASRGELVRKLCTQLS